MLNVCRMTVPAIYSLPGSGLEGASDTARETMTWSPAMGSPDQIINGVKFIIDQRSYDTAQNDSWAQAAITMHRDGIVGSQYTLNCKPNAAILGLDPDDKWLDDFAQIVEARFNAVAESDACWLDASRRFTLTQMCRQAVGSIIMAGEILAPVEWIRDADRPCRTALHLISPSRLSNNKDGGDQPYDSTLGYSLVRGIQKDYYGKHLGYWIRRAHPGDYLDRHRFDWNYVPAQLPWGRRQMLYITDPMLVEQTRGVGDMVAALPHMRMSKKHAQIALQKAVIGATYAAVLESDLPPTELAAAMGALNSNGSITSAEQLIDGWEQMVGSALGIIQTYMSGSKNISADGAQVPALPPGTKLNMLNADNGGGAPYSEFEKSLNRKTAAALNMTLEQFTRDYSNTNYSGGKLAGATTDRFWNARRKFTIDALAGGAYTLWLEEEIANPDSPVPLPPGWNGDRTVFYHPLMKEALTACSWIGTGSGQIDELKETQAAILRIRSGLSTWSIECAKLGIDVRDMAAQQKREAKLFSDAGLSFTQDAMKPTNALKDNSDQNDTSADDPAGANT